MSFLETFRLELEAISPVHVGTGETYPAYAYVPDFEKKEVHLLDPGVLLLALPEARRRQYLEKVAQGPKAAQEVLRYLYQEGQLPQEAVVRALPASIAFLKAIQEATQEALLEYQPLPYSPLGPYLPGSSVKGALRTAWLFWVLVERDQVAEFREGVWRLRNWEEGDGEVYIRPPRTPKLAENQAFEGAVLGYAKEARKLDLYRDPFRAVRLTDSAPQETCLDRIGVFHSEKDTLGPALLAETFRKGSRFTLGFRYHGGLSRHRGVSMPIPPKDLQRALREYYTKVAEWERGFAEEHRLKNALGVYEELFQRLKDPEVFPIRVGFGSGRLASGWRFFCPRTTRRPRSPRPGRPWEA
jgi:CRISPR-associated protein Csm5